MATVKKNYDIFEKHLNNTFKAAAIMLPSQILNLGRVSYFKALKIFRSLIIYFIEYILESA